MLTAEQTMRGQRYIPVRKVGYLYPQQIIDYGPYEFYRMVPDRVLIVGIPVGLTEFSTAEADRVFAPVEKLCQLLAERHVDIIVQGGVPLALMLGRDRLRQLLDYIEHNTNIPATATVLCALEAAKALGVKNIAVINKWNETMNERLVEFFTDINITVAGTVSRSLQPREFNKMSSDEGVQLSYELGKTALQTYPQVDALFIGGGAWLTLPVVLQLEWEFGKPVIALQPATAWHVCKRLDYWQPKRDMGAVLALP